MFQGIYTPIITVFDESGLVYPVQERLVNRLVKAGVDGVLFCGSIGEFHGMSLEQKKELLSWAAGCIDSRIQMLAGTGGNCVADVLALTEYAGSIGADAAVVMSPFYFQLDEAALYRYYSAVAKVGVPIILYNFPDRTGVSMSADLVCRLAADCPAIVGIKDTVDTISHTRDLILRVKKVRPDFCVLSGYDEYLIPNLIAGGDGILTGLTNVSPELFVSLRQAYLAGDLMTVTCLQQTVNKLMSLYTVTPNFISSIKAAVDLVAGNVSSDLLMPAAAADDAERQTILFILRDAGLLA